MNTRIRISVLLVLLGLFLALFPEENPGRYRISPQELARWATADSMVVFPDEVARWINSEEQEVTLIDVRHREEYAACRLPGALSVPLEEITDPQSEDLLRNKGGKLVFYSNDEEAAAAAQVLAAGMGHSQVYRMSGGMNAWFETVMNSSFSGERITARENALFTQRLNARKLFTRYNSLPDSLKENLFVTRRLEKARMDGGCE
jgi:rhodanese-related sulfurtransferase